jgi:steroid delta-isomerase-like uncharacterized protein
MAETESARLLRALFGAFNDRDLDRIESIHADDFELIDVATGTVFRGPAGARENCAGWLDPFPDIRAELVSPVVASDGWAVVEWVGRGTHESVFRGPGVELPPTGRAFELRMCTWERAEGGKLVAARDYYDLGSFLRQLGG